MDDPRVQDYYDDLYKRAENWLKTAVGSEGLGRSGLPKNLDLLLQELIIHRVELEMQNEELREIQTQTDSSLRKYKDFFKNAPVGMLELDAQGRTIEMNDTLHKLLDNGSGKGIYRPFFSYISNGDRNKFSLFLNSVFNHGYKGSCRLTLLRTDKSLVEVLLQASRLDKFLGKTCLVMVQIIPEIIEPSLNQDSGNPESTAAGNNYPEMIAQSASPVVLQSNSELDTIISILAHDLQEPAVNVERLAELLFRQYRELIKPEHQEIMQLIISEAVRMRIFVRELLNLSRINTRPGPEETVDCNSVLERALSSLQKQINECHAEITFDTLPVITADKTQIELLFRNLISNAIKYCKQGVAPVVDVSCKDNEYEWVFSVKDNGIGIDPKFHNRIFGIFQRLHIQSEYEGTGVGLSICERIVQRHNGRIWVDSEEGKGATFYFTIPK